MKSKKQFVIFSITIFVSLSILLVFSKPYAITAFADKSFRDSLLFFAPIIEKLYLEQTNAKIILAIGVYSMLASISIIVLLKMKKK
ncbi:hypothetical protein [Halanaerobacter jeridensis]|uniref:Uncharacterized protein n=1 Tax=Halanaerobacter jeridensis TaxID=706427 RepID=A0A938XY24_9FIRM|nr:hypothetical protein [Halanaerobacter jeridensis]MBM7557777.1 hypothetical protein [Halanaerobacter jeridensis]